MATVSSTSAAISSMSTKERPARSSSGRRGAGCLRDFDALRGFDCSGRFDGEPLRGGA